MKRYLFFICMWMTLVSTLCALTPIHEPLDEVLTHREFEIDVRIPGSDSSTQLRFYYKTDTETLYRMIPISFVGDEEFNLIYNPELNGDALEYYLEIEHKGTKTTYPEFDPEENPIEVLIRKPSGAKPVITFVTPIPDTVLMDSDQFVLITIDDPDQSIFVDSIRIAVDNQELTNKADISESFISLPLEGLRDGKHKIDVIMTDYRGKTIRKQSSFKTYEKLPPFMTINGEMSFNGNYFHTTQESGGFARGSEETQYRTRLNITMQQLVTELNVLRDSRDIGTQQPLNRLGFKIHDKNKHFRAELGDFTPYLSDMSLNYLFVHGYDIEADLLAPLGAKRGLVVRSIKGRTKRSIAISSPNVTQGIYEQNITATQVQLNFLKSKNSLNYVKISDNLNSLSSAVSDNVTPVENHVFSVANKFSLLKTKIKLESAASIHYSDTTAALVDDIEDLDLPIKGSLRDQVLKEFPARSSLFIGYGSKLSLQRDIVPRKVRFNGKVNYVSPGFTSLGSASVQKDIFEYGGDLSVRTFRNRINLTGGIKRSHDNVLLAKEKMTFADTYTARASTYVPKVGSFFVAYNTTQRQNKTVNTDSQVTGNLRVKNNLKSVSLGVGGIQFKGKTFTNTLNTNYTYSNFDDDVTTTNTFDTHTGGINLQSYAAPFTVSLGLNLTNQINHTATPNTTLFSSYSAKIDMDAIPNILKIFAGVDVNTGLNKGRSVDSREDTVRTTYTIGGSISLKQFSVFKSPRLNLNWTMANSEDRLNKDDKSKNFDNTLFSVQFNSRF